MTLKVLEVGVGLVVGPGRVGVLPSLLKACCVVVVVVVVD